MPERIQRKRSKGWRMPENTVYVGRPTIWGNPYHVGDGLCRTIEEAVKYYHIGVLTGNNFVSENFIPSEDIIRKRLKGKNLACWCKEGEPCHADILLEIANSKPIEQINLTAKPNWEFAPKWANWFAVTSFGIGRFYKNEPKIVLDKLWHAPGKRLTVGLFRPDDWKNSLQKRPTHA